MTIIDLTLPITHQMPTYPGDPEIIVSSALSISKDGWNVQRIQLNSHIGTHVNVPFHSAPTGKKLGAYVLSDFIGEAVIFEKMTDIQSQKGVIFRDQNIDEAMASFIKKKKPPFIGLSADFVLNEQIEIDLLAAGVISFENLTNLAALPKTFTFFGIPLKIENGDGSTVRAFAIIA